MSENFKLNEDLLDELNYFHVSDFQIQDDYSTSKKTVIIKFYIEKMITNDYGYDEALELYFDGKLFLNYDEKNVFVSYNTVIYGQYYFMDIENSDNEGVVDLYDDYFSIGDIGLTKSDAIFEIDNTKEEIGEFLDKNAKHLVIFLINR